MTVLGYSVEEIYALGENFLPKLMHPDDFKHYLKETIPRYQTAGDGELMETEFRMKSKSRKWRCLHCREFIFMRQDDGSPKQIFGIVHDISERKHAEAELEKQLQNN